MVSKANQVVLAPFNSGGHWALLAINAYEDTVFYLDSLRTTLKEITRYIDTQKPYSQAELDEVRVELTEFLGSYI
uniref:Ubiquitin-like protease family profile domain-containing protein n=1 Tax=Cucumis melo TaxID=3656 RepID=A0A9I9EJM9_CUCME